MASLVSRDTSRAFTHDEQRGESPELVSLRTRAWKVFPVSEEFWRSQPPEPIYASLRVQQARRFLITFLGEWPREGEKPTDAATLLEASDLGWILDETRVRDEYEAMARREHFRAGGNVGPIHYRLDPWDESEQFEEIDLDLLPGKDCDWEVRSNGYQVQAWASRQNDVDKATPSYVVRFTRAGHWVEMAPLGLYWTNDAGETEDAGRLVPGIEGKPDDEAHTLTYPDAFGPGLHWRVNITPDHLYPTIILDKELPAPSIDPRGLRLVKSVALRWDDVAALSGVVQTAAPAELKTDPATFTAVEAVAALKLAPIAAEVQKLDKDAQPVTRQAWWMQTPRAWDSGEGEEHQEIPVKWELVESGGAWAAHFSVAAEDLEHKVYPLYLDTDIGEEQVGASADDAETNGYTWPGTTTFNGTADVLKLGVGYNDVFHGSGVRFQTVPIPQGATIDSASISVKQISEYYLTEQTDITIYAQAVDSGAAWAQTTNEPGLATRTTASTQWNIGTTAWVWKEWYQSPDIKAVVKEITDRAGWASNHHLNLLIYNTSTDNKQYSYRWAGSYDSSGNVSGAKLNVSYTAGGAAYDETGRSQAITMAQTMTDVQAMSELGRSQALTMAQTKVDTSAMAEGGRAQSVLFSQAALDTQAAKEEGRAQAILLTQGEADTQAYAEAGLAQGITVLQAPADVQAYLETLRSQGVSVGQTETDSKGMFETGRAQGISVSQSEADAMAMNEGGRAQGITLGQTPSDVLGAKETGRAQSIIVAQTVTDLQAMLEAAPQAILLVIGEIDLYSGVSHYDETGRGQGISLSVAAADLLAALETGRNQDVNVGVQGTDSLGLHETGRAQSILVGLGASDVLAANEAGLAQVIVVQGTATDLMTMLETGKAQVILVTQAELDSLVAAGSAVVFRRRLGGHRSGSREQEPD
jgi:hypothetical protein